MQIIVEKFKRFYSCTINQMLFHLNKFMGHTVIILLIFLDLFEIMGKKCLVFYF